MAGNSAKTHSLRIVCADDEQEMREYYSKVLPRLGYEVVAVAIDGADLIAQCRTHEPDLVITDIKMPGADGIDAVHEICREKPIPIIIVSAHNEPEFVDRALNEQILAYLVKPIKQSDLEPAIALTMRRYKEFQVLHEQTDNLRQALEDRKIIERAKGILMQRADLDEQTAFRRLQKLACDKNQKMVEIAKTIVTAEEAFTAT